VALALVTTLLGACGSGAGSATSGKLQVAAAENFWGSIAAQLGGDRVSVTSIIANPNTDPHSYEPAAGDARTIAQAQLVIVNGVGYDPWAPRLVAANPLSGRVVLDVGQLVHIAAGGNPHRWYSPSDVMSVVDQITRDYSRLDPKDAAYFAAQQKQFVNQGLAQYRQLIATIKSKYTGTPVGASESIFAPLAQALGLKLITPPSFLAAISEGTGPTAADKATIDRQIASGQLKVYVYNSQNATPDVQAQVNAATARGIPVTTITETLTPPTTSFQDWQVTQLRALEAALAKATGH
jgi:zinc/manganese transport system substrate-binding protein